MFFLICNKRTKLYCNELNMLEITTSDASGFTVSFYHSTNYYVDFLEKPSLEIQGLLVRDSPKALCCVLEQDTLSSA